MKMAGDGADLQSQLESLVPGISATHVKISNREGCLAKLNALRKGKAEKLQVIADYDLTITKHHVNGVPTHSSFGLFTLFAGLPEDFIEKNRSLKEKYFPIEMNTEMSHDEKIPHMVNWYAECDRMFDGVPLNREQLGKIAKDHLPELREGSVELFALLKAKQVPVLVLSAGLGDVIKAVLDNHSIHESDHLHIVSNFFKIQNDVIKGFGCHENGEFIHPFNKNGLGCATYFQNRTGRNNVILMGDSIGDADMNAGVPGVENVLKIGFLYGTEKHISNSLPNYLSHFDIVLIDDQTMNIPRGVFDLIL